MSLSNIKIVFCDSGVRLENVPVRCLSLDIRKENGAPGVFVAELAALESAVDSVDALGKIKLVFLFWLYIIILINNICFILVMQRYDIGENSFGSLTY